MGITHTPGVVSHYLEADVGVLSNLPAGLIRPPPSRVQPKALLLYLGFRGSLERTTRILFAVPGSFHAVGLSFRFLSIFLVLPARSALRDVRLRGKPLRRRNWSRSAFRELQRRQRLHRRHMLRSRHVHFRLLGRAGVLNVFLSPPTGGVCAHRHADPLAPADESMRNTTRG